MATASVSSAFILIQTRYCIRMPGSLILNPACALRRHVSPNRQRASPFLCIVHCTVLRHRALNPEINLGIRRQPSQEMFRQGDRERAAGLPLSSLMDRQKAGITRLQVRAWLWVMGRMVVFVMACVV